MTTGQGVRCSYDVNSIQPGRLSDAATHLGDAAVELLEGRREMAQVRVEHFLANRQRQLIQNLTATIAECNQEDTDKWTLVNRGQRQAGLALLAG